MKGGYQIIDFKGQVHFAAAYIGQNQTCVGVYEQVDQTSRSRKPFLFTNFADSGYNGFPILTGTTTNQGVKSYVFTHGIHTIYVNNNGTCRVTKLIN